MGTDQHSFVKNNAILLFFITFVGFFCTLGFNMFLSTKLGTRDYGDFKVAESVIELFALIALMGGGKAAVRFLPKHIMKGNGSVVWAYLKLYIKLVMVISLLFSSLLLVAGVLHLHLFKIDFHPVYVAAVAIPFAAFCALLGGILQTAKHIGLAFAPWNVGYPLLILAGCIFLFYGLGELTDVNAVAVVFVSALLVTCYLGMKVVRLKLVDFTEASLEPHARQWLSVSLPLMYISVLQALIVQINIFMLEIMGTEESVGLYASASTTLGFYFVFRQAITSVIVPLVYETRGQGIHAVRQLNGNGFRLLLLSTAALTAFILAFTDWILSLYGSEGQLAKNAMYILMLGYIPSCIFAMSLAWLKYSGHEKFVLVALVVSVSCNVVLGMALIPKWGVEGASIATAASMVLMSITVAIKLYRELGIFPWSGSLGTKVASEA